ncbi:MAG: hypothetical protein LC725_08690 [Lentisphaerae bacterium]|nr:hypothetical protein [Lentisphaerota bacterium]
MHKLKVGYLPLVKGSWINDSLEGRRQAALRALADLGVEIIEGGRRARLCPGWPCNSASR